jgi:hypothetical protein
MCGLKADLSFIFRSDGNEMLAEEVNSAVHELRGALLDLVSSVGCDPNKPQDISRQFGLDKSLTWKVSRVVAANAPDEALVHMPGDSAFEIFITAMERKGAKRNLVRRTRDAIQSFQKIVDAEVGDRPTLAIVLDALASRNGERLANSRRQAFRGNSGIWGVQARVRYNTIVLWPNSEDPSMVDVVQINGWIDFRRIRSDVRWPLFQVGSFRNGESVDGELPIDPDTKPHGPTLLTKFCGENMPDISVRPADVGRGEVYELGPGPIGNSGLFSCFCGSVHRKLGARYASVPGETADFMAGVAAPVEWFVFDLVVDRRLDFASTAKFACYGSMHTSPTTLLPHHQLPIPPVESDLGRFPPVMSSSLVSNYADVMDYSFGQLGLDLKDFAARRWAVEFPVYPSTVVVTCPLEEPK